MNKTIYLTEEDMLNKKALEDQLQGAKLTYTSIYRRGLQSLKETLPIKIIRLKGEESQKNEELGH